MSGPLIYVVTYTIKPANKEEARGASPTSWTSSRRTNRA